MASKRTVANLEYRIALDRLLETGELSTLADTDTASKNLFRVRGRQVNKHYEEFRRTQAILVTLASSEEVEEIQSASKVADEAYTMAQATHERLFPPVQPIPRSEASVDGDAPAENGLQMRRTVRLPKLNLPVFDGDLKSWIAFRDMFNGAIHEEAALTNAEKFQYLIVLLSGVPLRMINSLSLTNDNYPIAYDMLINRYNNKRALATEHWHAIQSVPAASTDSVASLQLQVDTFTRNIAALKTLDYPTNNWDFILFNLMLDKLDIETKKSFEKAHATIESPTFDHLKKIC